MSTQLKASSQLTFRSVMPEEPSAMLAQQLASMLDRLCSLGEDKALVEISFRLVLESLEKGNVFLDMNEGLPLVGLDSVNEWQGKLLEKEVAGVSNKDESVFTPLIIDSDRLYLARYFSYQSSLEERLENLAKENAEDINLEAVAEILNRLFPEKNVKPNWQKVAAAVALSKRLCVISGGPGTGKTTTVLRLLAALIEANNSDAKLRIRLAAPTGKAAARMQESIRNNLQSLDCSEAIKEKLEFKASTLHRLLGYRANSVQFRHNKSNPLPLDVLVIDESSMIGSAMMAKCLDALPEHARLILLGDKDQLAAVEPGSPFATMCENFGFSPEFAQQIQKLSAEDLGQNISDEPHSLANNLVFLSHSYRFGDDSGIGNLAKAVNAGDYESAFSLMSEGDYPDIHWEEYPVNQYRHYRGQPNDPLTNRVKTGFSPYLEAIRKPEIDLAEVFGAFTQFCLLTAIHNGACGRLETNQLCERVLGFAEEGYWYHGRPVMVTSNNYQLGLFNGDVGICLDLHADGNLRVYFPTSDGFKDFIPGRIPNHETAFAMTVHKSQGSEFSEVLFLLPDSRSTVLNKALVYTAITRAKDKVEIWGLQNNFLELEN